MEEGGEASGGFLKPRPGVEQDPTVHLFVANCGPAVGLSFDMIEKAFSSFGPVSGICAAGESGTRVVISFEKLEDAVTAKEAWNGHKCTLLHDRIMFIQFSVPQPPPVVEDHHPVMTTSLEVAIPGLVLYPDFISVEEEQELLAAVDQFHWQSLAKRRVQHYGYEFLYKSRNVDLSQKLGELPTFTDKVLERISTLPELTEAGEPSLPLDQLTVNEYPRGVGLSPHIDTHSAFEGSIISLSLAGPCVMEFRKYINAQRRDPGGKCGEEKDGESSAQVTQDSYQMKNQMDRRALLLPQRSLLVLSQEARYAWHHYIPHHKVDHVNGETISRASRRVSFTFRKVRSGSCCCQYVGDCDSQSSGQFSSPFLSSGESRECSDLDKLGGDNDQDTSQEKVLIDEMKHNTKVQGVQQTASSTNEDMYQGRHDQQVNVNEPSVPFFTPEIEKQYVHKVYDAIAPHFSSTRFAKWPKVASFLDSLAPGSIVADSGCGNGKYLGLNRTCYFIGCDISPPLVTICEQRGHEALVADALHLPYRTGFYDAAISIAVLHHLSSDQRRVRAIEELVRVVSAGGKVLITVWAVEQEDQTLVKKWTPLSEKYTEEWVNDEKSNHFNRIPSSLEMIQEGDGGTVVKQTADKSHSETDDFGSRLKLQKKIGRHEKSAEDEVVDRPNKMQEQQEFFVPWHLPYHRAEVNGASAAAIASGFARKDDKKGAVVYNRYYHVFTEGELERLASRVEGVVIIDRFYDKSNWCIILEKL